MAADPLIIASGGTMSTATHVEELDVKAAVIVHAGQSLDPFISSLVQAMRLASEDQLDTLDKAHPTLVHAERIRRRDPERLQAVATIYGSHGQCLECGWPMDGGYRPAPGEDDVEGWGKCLNPTCDNEY